MDKQYWNALYQTQHDILKPSSFAKMVRKKYAAPMQSLLELGCGNGRDAVFFANEGVKVTAIDQCENAINAIKEHNQHLANCVFIPDDFTELRDFENPFDIVYSRFTLHSVTETQEKRTLRWAHGNLRGGGYFCIEVRGQKNEIYGMGEKVEGETDAYIHDSHYRRFLNFDKLCESLKSLGFCLNFAAEAKDFAPYAGQNETFIRIIAQKTRE